MPVAAQTEDAAAEVADAAGLSSRSIFDIIGTLINVVLGLLGIVFLGLVLYAGWLWMTAQGDPKQVDKAKQILINATVGIVITLSAYAITTFIVNLIQGATGLDDGNTNSASGTVSIERLSGSLGNGALRDHYPERNATDVVRNTRIMVTFRDSMDIASFIEGYDTNDTPTDISDDTVANALNADNIKIYITTDGIEAALTDVSVAFSDDLTTFVFDPAAYLGSPTESVSYTIFLGTDVLDADGDRVFEEGYEWSFETGTSIDTDPPAITSVVPVDGGSYARNIAVQITFDEAVDPTVASGTRTSSGGFDAIQTAGADAAPLSGTYDISNGYKTVTFTTEDACGTNSCGETMYCLPGSDKITTTVVAATPGTNPPQVDIYPYDGIVDISGNALDGNSDGTAGDDYMWSFTTTDAISLEGPTISSISPNISEENVALDQVISIIFDDVLLASSVDAESIVLSNEEVSTGKAHEMWYRFDTAFLSADGSPIVSDSAAASRTLVEISHGTFLESVDGLTYMYGVAANEGIKNQYQNCFVPAEGPSAEGGGCNAGPYCCNGVSSLTACTLF